MSKLPGYNFGNIDQELEDWRDQVTEIINLGKVQYPTVLVAPTWSGNKGEGVFVMPDSGGTTFYVMRNTAWVAGWSVTI